VKDRGREKIQRNLNRLGCEEGKEDQLNEFVILLIAVRISGSFFRRESIFRIE